MARCRTDRGRTSSIRRSVGALAPGYPTRVLLRDKAFELLREQASGVVRIRIMPGACEVEKLLMLKRLASGPIGNPVVLELAELLQPFQDQHCAARCRRDPSSR